MEETKHFSNEKVWAYQNIIIEDSKIKRYITWDHYYSKDEIKNLLNTNKFEIISINENLIFENEFSSKETMFIEVKKRIEKNE